MKASSKLILMRALMLIGAIALFPALMLVPSPWQPERVLHGVVVSADFGRAGRWVSGSRALISVRLADGSVVDSVSDARVLPRVGDVIKLRQRLGLFGQTLVVTPLLGG